MIGLGTDATDEDWDWARAEQDAFASGEVAAVAPSFPPPSGTKPGPPAGESSVRVVDVALRRLPGSAIAEGAACAGDDCSPPLRAAVAVAPANAGGGTCSAGFIGYWWSGSTYVPFVMTMGHCILGASNPWRAYDPALGASRTIGDHWNWRFGDLGTTQPWVRRDLGEIEIKWNSHWFSWIDGTMQMWGWPPPTGEWWPITGQDIMAPGRFGCRSGITTTYTCGHQQYQSLSIYVNSNGTIQPIDNMYNVPYACANPGDSGGPFVDGTTALGLTSAYNGCDSYYQHVFDVGYYFGVWAAT